MNLWKSDHLYSFCYLGHSHSPDYRLRGYRSLEKLAKWHRSPWIVRENFIHRFVSTYISIFFSHFGYDSHQSEHK